MLEACKGAEVKKLILASSSSMYGDAERLPTPEDALTKPVSPYGATKLAAEHLCRLYFRNFELPMVILRYFTVYGPRQGLTMAFNRFISRISQGERIEVYGKGLRSRDFTYVDDVVNATLLALDAKKGGIYNVGSGATHPLSEAITLLEKLIGRKASVSHSKEAAGDVSRTSADISKIGKELGYRPRTPLREGLSRQVVWQKRTGRRKKETT